MICSVWESSLTAQKVNWREFGLLNIQQTSSHRYCIEPFCCTVFLQSTLKHLTLRELSYVLKCKLLASINWPYYRILEECQMGFQPEFWWLNFLSEAWYRCNWTSQSCTLFGHSMKFHSDSGIFNVFPVYTYSICEPNLIFSLLTPVHKCGGWSFSVGNEATAEHTSINHNNTIASRHKHILGSCVLFLSKGIEIYPDLSLVLLFKATVFSLQLAFVSSRTWRNTVRNRHALLTQVWACVTSDQYCFTSVYSYF